MPIHGPDAEVHPRLCDYFEALQKAFGRAASQADTVRQIQRLAGHRLETELAGPSLQQVFLPSMAHLPPGTSEDAPGLKVLAWDEAQTGVPLPPPPWDSPPPAEGEGEPRLTLPPGGERFRISLSEHGALFMMFSLEERLAVICCRDARRLPTYIYSAPFPAVIHWWSPLAGLRLLHAGCVGDGHGAALLTGPSGSGKSTTSLLCALAGLQYLSDDLCLVRTASPARAHCLFNSGKLLPGHLRQFPELASRAIDPMPGIEGKPVVFMHAHYPARVATELPLRVILSARVSGRPETASVPISPGEALRALAPSTLFPRSHPEAAAFHNMAHLVRSLPCYRIELGTRMDEIPAEVARLLQTHR